MPLNERNNPPILITRFQELKDVVTRLNSGHCLAVDLESDRMYRYQIRTCLIQLAGPSQQAYLVDPIELTDVSLLAPRFENPAIEKILLE